MSLPETFRAAQVVEHGKDLVINNIPLVNPGYDQILVKIEVTGVCHTDLHVQTGDWKVKCAINMVPGHEGVGTIVKLGPGVENLKVGDRVCVPWLHKSCGSCENCWKGWETVCEKQKRTGFTINGTFAEYAIADSRFVGKVPDNLSSEQAAPITCAGVTVYKGLKMSDVKPGQTVVIVGGAGGLGHVAIQYAKAMGMKIIGIDAGAKKVEFMKSLGADFAIDASAEKDIVKLVKSYTNGFGAHGALILVPVKEAIGEAVRYMRPLGVVVPIALPPGDFAADVFDLVLNAITIRGSIVGTRLDLQEALEFAAQGKVKCDVQMRKFDEVNQVLKELAAGQIKGRVVLKL